MTKLLEQCQCCGSALCESSWIQICLEDVDPDTFGKKADFKPIPEVKTELGEQN